MHAGSWTVQLVHSVSVNRAGEVEGKGGGGEGVGGGLLPEQTLWKNSTGGGGGRGHATSCEGTALKSEVVNPV